MSNPSDAVTNLSETECWELLATQKLGRLGTSVVNEPEIFPVNFVVDDRTILFRTAGGSKLLELTINNKVAFEVDDHDDEEGWSVLIRGVADPLEHSTDIAAAERLGLQPWIPTIKRVFVRIRPHVITGRRFKFGAEPANW